MTTSERDLLSAEANRKELHRFLVDGNWRIGLIVAWQAPLAPKGEVLCSADVLWAAGTLGLSVVFALGEAPKWVSYAVKRERFAASAASAASERDAPAAALGRSASPDWAPLLQPLRNPASEVERLRILAAETATELAAARQTIARFELETKQRQDTIRALRAELAQRSANGAAFEPSAIERLKAQRDEAQELQALRAELAYRKDSPFPVVVCHAKDCGNLAEAAYCKRHAPSAACEHCGGRSA